MRVPAGWGAELLKHLIAQLARQLSPYTTPRYSFVPSD
jgi:hypothetical protein